MSWDIHVVNSKDKSDVCLKSKHSINGGTFAIGGTDMAWLNITYNYSEFYYRLWPIKRSENGEDIGGIRTLYGIPLRNAVEMLKAGISKLRGRPCEDYWKPTSGNAKAALQSLLAICEAAIHDYPNTDMELSGD